MDVWDVQVCVVITGPGSGTCCPLACLCCSRWGGVAVASAHCFTHLWACLDFRGTWPGTGPLCGCLGRLALSGIGWGLCRGIWGRSGSWGPGPVPCPSLGGWGLAGSVGCCPWSPGGLCPMLMGALSWGFLCSLLGGCVDGLI